MINQKESALYHAVKYNWQGFWIAVYENYKNYSTKNKTEKQHIVFELIKQGLNDISEVDKWDKKRSMKLRIVLNDKTPAPNKRFGVMRGVCSQKVLREFESLSPVRAFAFPRPNAKPPTVGCQLQTDKQYTNKH